LSIVALSHTSKRQPTLQLSFIYLPESKLSPKLSPQIEMTPSACLGILVIAASNLGNFAGPVSKLYWWQYGLNIYSMSQTDFNQVIKG
jgi:hypothetical protein